MGNINYITVEMQNGVSNDFDVRDIELIKKDPNCPEGKSLLYVGEMKVVYHINESASSLNQRVEDSLRQLKRRIEEEEREKQEKEYQEYQERSRRWEEEKRQEEEERQRRIKEEEIRNTYYYDSFDRESDLRDLYK